jgi:hypothetical protein
MEGEGRDDMFPQCTVVTWRVEGKLMPENFPADIFLGKANKCDGVYIVNYSIV